MGFTFIRSSQMYSLLFMRPYDMPENIVKRLRESAQQSGLMGDAWQAALLHEAADEIEYLRDRCEQLDMDLKEFSHVARNKRPLA